MPRKSFVIQRNKTKFTQNFNSDEFISINHFLYIIICIILLIMNPVRDKRVYIIGRAGLNDLNHFNTYRLI